MFRLIAQNWLLSSEINQYIAKGIKEFFDQIVAVGICQNYQTHRRFTRTTSMFIHFWAVLLHIPLHENEFMRTHVRHQNLAEKVCETKTWADGFICEMIQTWIIQTHEAEMTKKTVKWIWWCIVKRKDSKSGDFFRLSYKHQLPHNNDEFHSQWQLSHFNSSSTWEYSIYLSFRLRQLHWKLLKQSNHCLKL